MSIAEKLKTISQNLKAVFEAGEKAKYNEFWDSAQGGGYNTYYTHAFAGCCWTDTTFRPKYNIRAVNSAAGMFRQSNITKLGKCLTDAGVTLDLSGATSANSMFAYSKVEALPELDLSGAKDVQLAFASCTKLTTIAKVIINPEATFNRTFEGCTSLNELIIDGTIGKNGFDVSACPLSHASLISILTHLSTNGTDKTITLGATNLETLNTEEGNEKMETARSNGWTLA